MLQAILALLQHCASCMHKDCLNPSTYRVSHKQTQTHLQPSQGGECCESIVWQVLSVEVQGGQPSCKRQPHDACSRYACIAGAKGTQPWQGRGQSQSQVCYLCHMSQTQLSKQLLEPIGLCEARTRPGAEDTVGTGPCCDVISSAGRKVDNRESVVRN